MRKSLILAILMLAVFAGQAFSQPAIPAPDPTEPADEVTSLYSNSYADATVVDTWSADWDMADVADIQISGNDTKEYTNLVFAGIEFTSQLLDATGRAYFHMDIWTPDPTDTGQVFRIKLVDFGADGMYQGGDDSEHEITLTAADGLATGEWVSFMIDMDDFAGLANQGHLAQLIISGDLPTVYIDNIYFSGVDDGGDDPEPMVAAPTPTYPAGETTSLFSDDYDNAVVDTWSAAWDAAEVEDIQIAGNDTKKYTAFVFAGVEFTSQPIDASNHTHFRMDIWFPGPSQIGDVFKIKLVDFGPDGMFDGGDDSEHELVFDAASDPALVPEQWITFDIPLDDFTNLAGRGALAQLIMVSDPGANTVYIDNVMFHGSMDPVSLSMTPVGSTAVPQGGFLNFNVEMTNNTAQTGTIYLFTEAETPNGNVVGPLLNVTGLTMAPNQSFSFNNIAQSIPAFAPTGNFIYRAKVLYGPILLASDQFGFEIVPAPAASMGNTDWSVSGTRQIDEAMGMVAGETELPTEFATVSAYPNPFNPTTTVHLTLPSAADVQVVVHNSLGRQVASLASGAMGAGSHALTFDGSNLASGLYFVQATVDGAPLQMTKMMLLK